MGIGRLGLSMMWKEQSPVEIRLKDGRLNATIDQILKDPS